MTATWTATVNRNVGDTGSSSDINTYIGVNGNIDYLKSKTDAMATCTQSDVTASRAIDGSVYQNTSGKIILVSVSVSLTGTSTLVASIIYYTGAANPPADQVGESEIYYVGSQPAFITTCDTVTFIVQPSYYYKAVSVGTTAKQSWIEWTLF